jgi:hypothetical protein
MTGFSNNYDVYDIEKIHDHATQYAASRPKKINMDTVGINYG